MCTSLRLRKCRERRPRPKLDGHAKQLREAEYARAGRRLQSLKQTVCIKFVWYHRFVIFRQVVFASFAWEVRKVAPGLASLHAASPAATPALQCRVEAFSKTLGTPIVTRAHKWRAKTVNSNLTPNSAQEAGGHGGCCPSCQNESAAAWLSEK
jgi:hypothetical protein